VRWIYGLGALLTVGAFVFWHSGGRADALCMRERFVSWAEFSLWPPGARCTFGEPAMHDTFVNPLFPGTVWVVLVLVAVASVRGSRSRA
jgi:hypothetical protein